MDTKSESSPLKSQVGGIYTVHGPAETLPRLTAYGTKILYVRAQRTYGHYYQGPGDLSIKCFFSGRVWYEADGGQFAMQPDSYLILNHDQVYTINRPPEAEAESFLAFFTADFATDVYRNASDSSESLLDEPRSAQPMPVNFYQRLYRHDAFLSPLIFRLRSELPHYGEDRVWLEEQCHDLLRRMLRVHREAGREVERLSSLRAATREELYRRLYYARDYAVANLERPLSLEEMARVACLSTNHLLRNFKQLFHQSPHQYLTQRRLERARRLLLHTDTSVTEICFDIGFESLGSFSSLFRRHVGVSPGAYRRGKGIGSQKGEFEEVEPAANGIK